MKWEILLQYFMGTDYLIILSTLYNRGKKNRWLAWSMDCLSVHYENTIIELHQINNTCEKRTNKILL